MPPPALGLPSKPLTIINYETGAWPDFIAHQLAPFGNLPVYLTPGNHETIPPATRASYLLQFADWLTTPTLRQQRLADDPADHALRSYYHWVDRNVDFIALDNSSQDQFDADQLKWLHSTLARDEASGSIRTIVVGMHASLPGSFGGNHSMSDWSVGETSGREVYEALWHAQDSAHKRVYILASHSHFYHAGRLSHGRLEGQSHPRLDCGNRGRGPLPFAQGRARGHRDGRCLRLPARHGGARRIHRLRVSTTRH